MGVSQSGGSPSRLLREVWLAKLAELAAVNWAFFLEPRREVIQWGFKMIEAE